MHVTLTLVIFLIKGPGPVIPKPPPSLKPGQVCNVAMDVVFLVDASRRIDNRRDWPKVVLFLKKYVGSLNVGAAATRIGLVTFSNTARVEFALNQYFESSSLQNAIGRMRRTGSGRRLEVGLNLVRRKVFISREGDRKKAKNVLIILSDVSTANYGRAISETKHLKRRGTHVMCIGVGATHKVRSFEYQLKTYASRPFSVNLFRSGYSKLNKLVSSVRTRCCQGKCHRTGLFVCQIFNSHS